MSCQSLGLIETAGYATAMVAADFALKAANVGLAGVETVIGVAKSLGVTIYLTGEVSAVQAAVEAGCTAARKIGSVVTERVIASPDDNVIKDMVKIIKLNQNK